MIPIVTAGTVDFLPGIKALRNSWLRNSPDGFSFHVLAYGDEAFAGQLDDLGIDYLLNPVLPARLPRHDSRVCAAMYATILVPELFQQPKSIFIDADAIILKPLDDLIVDMHGKACAGTLHETCVSEHVIGWDRKGRGAWTSVVVYDRSAWVKRGIYAKCLQAMNEDKYYFKCHDQSVLNLALNLDWYLFPRDYQLQAGRESTPKLINDAYILHFMGTKPWQEYPLHLQPAPAHKLFARKLWNQYA